MNVAALVFGAQIFSIESSSWQILPLMNMKCPSLPFFDNFGLKVNFIRYQNGYSSLFLQTICLENCSPAFHSEVVSVFFPEMGFMYAAKCWVLLVQPVRQSMSFYWGIEYIDVKRYQTKVIVFSYHFVVKVGNLFLWLSSFRFAKGLLSYFFQGVISIFVLVFFLYYPLKG